ncbi:uncharacterized protein LAJ45_08120 [Morchella importuna]|uniref:uncharacterized protein n=1 Tax=Morchella importuna TaxID=1174673 RepID=UPI001E8DA95F|nr:uncharacterized protein LAJ45_08120 [Morchella importuna]KAH8147656.1 hypothetical protein LAJ45_08120 [Morchella importuna]
MIYTFTLVCPWLEHQNPLKIEIPITHGKKASSSYQSPHRQDQKICILYALPLIPSLSRLSIDTRISLIPTTPPHSPHIGRGATTTRSLVFVRINPIIPVAV